ncbi:MAG: hypothetical protein NTX80_02880 [Candidatus Saccharibacteria bacterium]|nr:hypothetical protein [Candidatus Saccharibacteria bacterium]
MTTKTITRKTVTPKEKAFIELATKRVIKKYGKTLALLSKE